MTDPVELALKLLGKERELDGQREHVQRLSAKLSALNSRHQRLTGELASATRERARVDRVTHHEREPLISCPACGCRELADRREHRNGQIDLPKVISEITRFSTESAWCPCWSATASATKISGQPPGPTCPSTRWPQVNSAAPFPKNPVNLPAPS